MSQIKLCQAHYIKLKLAWHRKTSFFWLVNSLHFLNKSMNISIIKYSCWYSTFSLIVNQQSYKDQRKASNIIIAFSKFQQWISPPVPQIYFHFISYMTFPTFICSKFIFKNDWTVLIVFTSLQNWYNIFQTLSWHHHNTETLGNFSHFSFMPPYCLNG